MDNLLLRDDAGEWKSELLRVREQIHYQNMQIQHVNKELEQATHEGDNKKTDELRIYRTVLAREREHLRDQETLFLKAIYSDISAPNEGITCGNNGNSTYYLYTSVNNRALNHSKEMVILGIIRPNLPNPKIPGILICMSQRVWLDSPLPASCTH